MPAGEEVRRTKRKDADDEVAEEIPTVEKKNTDEIDSLIDEIDEVLEENAEEFVRSFVQKGGE